MRLILEWVTQSPVGAYAIQRLHDTQRFVQWINRALCHARANANADFNRLKLEAFAFVFETQGFRLLPGEYDREFARMPEIWDGDRYDNALKVLRGSWSITAYTHTH